MIMKNGSEMTVAQAQADLRGAYAGAGPGQIVVGIIWIATGAVLLRTNLQTAFAVLFFASFLIYPVTLLLARGVMRRSAEAKGNPMTPVVPEGLPIMIAVLFAAFLLMPYEPEAVMPLAVIATGTHYIPFHTAYGLKAFWFLGAVIASLGFGAIFGPVPSGAPLLFLVGGLVAAFGIYLTLRDRQE